MLSLEKLGFPTDLPYHGPNRPLRLQNSPRLETAGELAGGVWDNPMQMLPAARCSSQFSSFLCVLKSQFILILTPHVLKNKQNKVFKNLVAFC